ncbi:MAG: phosphate starvation-inducible protein PhoH [Clostridiales bacterium]|jgi:phosphate starvation-inducible PhoH-like protein|nr:phosphate starvation-inducible protein PhoH [Clostridiales bacterium]
MEYKIRIPDDIDVQGLFGNYDANIRSVEKFTGTEMNLRDGELSIRGRDPELAARIIARLIEALAIEPEIDPQKLSYLIEMESGGRTFDEKSASRDIICYTHTGRPLRPKTQAQKDYVDNIRNSDMVFGIGPAGTGKTYLACAMAINAYKNKEVERIILTRPAVEAGERLGFLPGDMQEKVDPYLRPLYDALYDVLGIDAAGKLREKGVIEVVPLAYMRGRTLDNAFIILDEAQNTTREQMKMFLTRMGFNSKVIVTGDITQIDLPGGTISGLKDALRILKGVEGIRFNTFTEVDVVRHELVKRIIRAYDAFDSSNKVRRSTSKGNKVSER